MIPFILRRLSGSVPDRRAQLCCSCAEIRPAWRVVSPSSRGEHNAEPSARNPVRGVAARFFRVSGRTGFSWPICAARTASAMGSFAGGRPKMAVCTSAKRLKGFEATNACLKRSVADAMLDAASLQDVLVEWWWRPSQSGRRSTCRFSWHGLVWQRSAPRQEIDQGCARQGRRASWHRETVPRQASEDAFRLPLRPDTGL